MNRPTSVTVIGWIWIGLGILMVFGGIMGLFSFMMMNQMSPKGIPAPPDDMPGGLGFAMKIFQYFYILALIQIILATFIIVSGIYFLKLRAWARTALEVVSWLGLTYTVGFGIYWIFACFGISNMSKGPSGNTPPDGFIVIMLVMGMVVIVMFSAPLVVMIKFLRGKTIRDAVSGNKSCNTPSIQGDQGGLGK